MPQSVKRIAQTVFRCFLLVAFLLVAALPATAVSASATPSETEPPHLEDRLAQAEEDKTPSEPEVELGAQLDTPDSSGWRFETTPYFWAPAIDVDTTVAGMTVNLDLSFGDIVDTFDVLGFSNRFFAWRDRWAVVLDTAYVDLDVEGNLFLLNAGVDVEDFLLDLGTGYRLVDGTFGESERPKSISLDAFGGLRYHYIKQKISPGLGPFSPVTLGGSHDYVEPVIGGRLIAQMSDKWHFAFMADVSGFGIGTASDVTFNTLAGFDYSFNDNVSGKLGYKFQYIDYMRDSHDGEFGLEGTFHGPWLGLTIHF